MEPRAAAPAAVAASREIAGFKAAVDRALREKGSSHPDVAATIAQFREAVEGALFDDIVAARQANLEESLWLYAHYAVIRYFRRKIAKMEGSAKTRPVEARKLQDKFVRFIKDTSAFYLRYIQHLASYFQLRELEPVLSRFRLQFAVYSGVAAPAQATPAVRDAILRSCSQTLGYLGDMSRYREAHSLAPGARDWSAAFERYMLARQLVPGVGTPYNQIGVMLTADDIGLASTCFFFRGATVREPYPDAMKNLALAFKKLGLARRQDDFDDDAASEAALVARMTHQFLQLHSIAFAECDDEPRGRARDLEISRWATLQLDVLNQLRLLLSDRGLGADVLRQMTVINIAAHHVAARRGPGLHTQLLLGFNVATVSCLLRLLAEQLDDVVFDAPESIARARQLNAIGRHLLQPLRLYSTWIVKHIRSLTADADDGYDLSMAVSDMWLDYSATVSTLYAWFPDLPNEQPEVLLDEDVDNTGFQPLDGAYQGVRAKAETFTLLEIDKFTSHLHPNAEVLVRVNDLLLDAQRLVNTENVPLALGGRKLKYTPRPTAPTAATPAAPRAFRAPVPVLDAEPSAMASMVSNMVDSLVGPEHSSQAKPANGKRVLADVPINQERKPSPAEEPKEEILFVGRNSRRPSAKPADAPAVIELDPATSSPATPAMPAFDGWTDRPAPSPDTAAFTGRLVTQRASPEFYSPDIGAITNIFNETSLYAGGDQPFRPFAKSTPSPDFSGRASDRFPPYDPLLRPDPAFYRAYEPPATSKYASFSNDGFVPHTQAAAVQADWRSVAPTQPPAYGQPRPMPGPWATAGLQSQRLPPPPGLADFAAAGPSPVGAHWGHADTAPAATYKPN
ncbi:uncharacterized protein V1510DRAFT_286904 [Dipodascopsis tothii]|uniref:uncharacterized protein n=1 Tax=Dipodascopsis tothii TaxID=44089 RepID=UPI0034CEC543